MRAMWLVLVAVGCSEGNKNATDDVDGAEATEGVEGVEGSVTFPDSGEVALVDGRAFDDGSLRVVLTSFPIDCATVEDGLGWNTPAGGVWMGFYPDEDDDAELFEGDGVQTNLTGSRAFAADVTDDGTDATGDVTLSDGSGEVVFSVEHCGAMDPFGS